MAAKLIFAILRREWRMLGWLALLSAAMWSAVLVEDMPFPRVFLVVIAMSTVMFGMAPVAWIATTPLARPILVLPLSRRQRGYAIWTLAVVGMPLVWTIGAGADVWIRAWMGAPVDLRWVSFLIASAFVIAGSSLFGLSAASTFNPQGRGVMRAVMPAICIFVPGFLLPLSWADIGPLTWLLFAAYCAGTIVSFVRAPLLGVAIPGRTPSLQQAAVDRTPVTPLPARPPGSRWSAAARSGGTQMLIAFVGALGVLALVWVGNQYFNLFVDVGGFKWTTFGWLPMTMAWATPGSHQWRDMRTWRVLPFSTSELVAIQILQAIVRACVVWTVFVAADWWTHGQAPGLDILPSFCAFLGLMSLLVPVQLWIRNQSLAPFPVIILAVSLPLLITRSPVPGSAFIFGAAALLIAIGWLHHMLGHSRSIYKPLKAVPTPFTSGG